jgi:hypothetical protein
LAVAVVPVIGASPQIAVVSTGTGISFASLRRFLGGGGEVKFVAGTVWPAQSQPIELQNVLQMRKTVS